MNPCEVDVAKNYRIVGNGVVFRLQFRFVTTEGKECWPFIGKSYIVAEEVGIRTLEPIEFVDVEEAVAYINHKYGISGVDKLCDTWIPVVPNIDSAYKSIQKYYTAYKERVFL